MHVIKIISNMYFFQKNLIQQYDGIWFKKIPYYISILQLLAKKLYFKHPLEIFNYCATNYLKYLENFILIANR